jgi:hypothetical protein
MTYQIMHQTRGDEKEDINFYYLQKNGNDCKLLDRSYFSGLPELCVYIQEHFYIVEMKDRKQLHYPDSNMYVICSFETKEEFTELMCEYII